MTTEINIGIEGWESMVDKAKLAYELKQCREFIHKLEASPNKFSELPERALPVIISALKKQAQELELLYSKIS